MRERNESAEIKTAGPLSIVDAGQAVSGAGLHTTWRKGLLFLHAKSPCLTVPQRGAFF